MKKNIENIGIVVIFFVMLGYALIISTKDKADIIDDKSIDFESNENIEMGKIEISNTEKEVESNGIIFSVNKKLNFLSLVDLLTNYDESKQYDSFKKQIYEDFKQYKDHKIFKYIEKKYGKQNNDEEGSFSKLDSLYIFINMFTNNNLEFNNQCPSYEEMTITVPKFVKEMKEMGKYLIDFYGYCGYEQYYEDHCEEYGEFAKKVSNIKTNHNYRRELEEFYGVNISVVKVNINVFGDIESSQWEKVKEDEITIITPLAVSYDFKDNEEKDIENNIGQRIWIQSANVYDECKIKKLLIPKDIQDKCKEKYNDKIKEYKNVEEYIKQGLNGALSTYITSTYFGGEMRTQLEVLTKMGFPFGDKLVEKIKVYDGNKDKYKNFEEFIPELLKVFAE